MLITQIKTMAKFQGAVLGTLMGIGMILILEGNILQIIGGALTVMPVGYTIGAAIDSEYN